MSTDDADVDGWTVGQRLLEEVGLSRADATTPAASELPIAPDQLDIAAIRNLGGRTVICPIADIEVAEESDNRHRIHGDEWITAAVTIPQEEWR